jgi:hypothetical protein
MTDPRRAHDTPDRSRGTNRGSGVLRPLLWLVLIISASGNVIASTADLDILVNVAFGLVSGVCAGVLVVHHYRSRRR